MYLSQNYIYASVRSSACLRIVSRPTSEKRLVICNLGPKMFSTSHIEQHPILLADVPNSRIMWRNAHSPEGSRYNQARKSDRNMSRTLLLIVLGKYYRMKHKGRKFLTFMRGSRKNLKREVIHDWEKWTIRSRAHPPISWLYKIAAFNRICVDETFSYLIVTGTLT